MARKPPGHTPPKELPPEIMQAAKIRGGTLEDMLNEMYGGLGIPDDPMLRSLILGKPELAFDDCVKRAIKGEEPFGLGEGSDWDRYLDPAFYAECIKNDPTALSDGVLRISLRNERVDSLCFYLDRRSRSIPPVFPKKYEIAYVTAIDGVFSFERTGLYNDWMQSRRENAVAASVKRIEEEIAEAAARFGLPEREFKAAVIEVLSGQMIQTPETARPESPDLPDKAPELYADRPRHPETGRRETIVQFLERVWGPWIESGALTRPDLRRLDEQADTALFNWQRKPENTLPDHLHILGKSESLREREAITPDDVRAARRLLSRARRQKPDASAKP